MNEMSRITGKDLVIELIKRLFISGISRTIINTILPIVISILMESQHGTYLYF